MEQHWLVVTMETLAVDTVNNAPPFLATQQLRFDGFDTPW